MVSFGAVYFNRFFFVFSSILFRLFFFVGLLILATSIWHTQYAHYHRETSRFGIRIMKKIIDEKEQRINRCVSDVGEPAKYNKNEKKRITAEKGQMK